MVLIKINTILNEWMNEKVKCKIINKNSKEWNNKWKIDMEENIWMKKILKKYRRNISERRNHKMKNEQGNKCFNGGLEINPMECKKNEE